MLLGDNMNNIYLLYGEEKQLIEDKINNIIDECKTINNEVDIIKYDFMENLLDYVLTDASMPSLLSSIKIIIGNNAFFLTSNLKKTDFDHNVDNLIRYTNNPNPDTILILITDSSLDERKKVVKELRNKACVLEFKKVNYPNLINMVEDKLTKAGYKIDRASIRQLLERVGDNLLNINNEIDKLMLYKLEDKVITEEDILALVPRTIDENVFDLIEAVVDKNNNKIFRIYHDLLNYGEEPIKIIVLLANQFRIIYQTKVLYQKGYTEKDIAGRLGIHPYRIKLAYEKGKLFEENTLLDYLNKLADLDIAIKTGQIDKNIGLELFLLQL
jgi:DNA polymerase-3 subunit delta